jgi:hypothetical protein
MLKSLDAKRARSLRHRQCQFEFSDDSMKRIRTNTYLLATLLVQAFAQTDKPAPYLKQAVISQTAEAIHIRANSPRPLLQSLDALQQKYGWVVDYEDPQYISHLDLVDAKSDGSHSQVPSGAEFTFDFPASTHDLEKTIRDAVDKYNQSKNPGRFELRHMNQGRFYVVGTAAHGSKGAMSIQQPLLDLPITLKAQERSIVDTINLICEAVSAQRHTAITIGVSPANLLAHTTVVAGGSKIPARELLIQSLMAGHRYLYWRLLFDPDSARYFLEIHSAPST